MASLSDEVPRNKITIFLLSFSSTITAFSEAHGKSIALEANLAALQIELNNMKNSQVSALSDAESEISEKSEELAAAQSAKESLESEKGSLQAAKESLESEKNTLQSEIATLTETSSTYKRDLETLTESYDGLQKQIESLNSEHGKLSEDLVTLQEQLAKASSERDAALTELDSVREEMNLKIEEEVLKKSELDNNLVVEQEQVKTLTSSLSDYEGQIAGYKSKLDEMQKLADQLDSVNGKFSVLLFLCVFDRNCCLAGPAVSLSCHPYHFDICLDI